jgi:hypothetical protein
MPAEYSIDPQRKLVTCSVWGVLTGDELTRHYEEIRADPRFESTYAQLADLSRTERIAMDRTTVRSEAQIPVFSSESRRAFVAPTDAQFGMARMFGMYAEDVGQNVRVFRDMDSALEWLQDWPTGDVGGLSEV